MRERETDFGSCLVRMSDDKQESSPEQQRDEIVKYAAQHGYEILDWYSDEGISGDRTDKRIQFQALWSAACIMMPSQVSESGRRCIHNQRGGQCPVRLRR